MGILHTPGPASLLKVQVSMDTGAGPPDIDLGLHPEGQGVQSCDQGTPQSRHSPGPSGRILWGDSSRITVYHSLGPSLSPSPGDSKLAPLLSPDAQTQSRTLAIDAVGHPLTLFLILAAIPALSAGWGHRTYLGYAHNLFGSSLDALLPFTGRYMPTEGAIETRASCRAL